MLLFIDGTGALVSAQRPDDHRRGATENPRRHAADLCHALRRANLRGGADRSSVDQLLAEETRVGIDRLEFYLGFGEKVRRLRDELLELLRALKGEGKRIAVYGASAKGSTLLNYFGIGSETLEFVVDRSSVKQGHLTPGTRLPIFPPDKLVEAMPEYVLLLTWNFADEILEQQAEYRRRGGRFIIPVPDVRVV